MDNELLTTEFTYKELVDYVSSITVSPFIPTNEKHLCIVLFSKKLDEIKINLDMMKRFTRTFGNLSKEMIENIEILSGEYEYNGKM